MIGDPVRHSRSPAIHNAAFAALGLDWVYVAFPVPAGAGAAAVGAMRTLALGGLSVTMPHKDSVAAAVDRLSPRAQLLGAVNCLAWDPEGALVGHNTDGDGFLRGLRADFGLDPAGCRCVVLGAGGAARAVVAALGGAGAARVGVVARRPDAAAAASALAGATGCVAGPADVAGADLVVNATPVGMAGPQAEGVPADPALLSEGQVVAELVYHPTETPLMRAAARAGARTANGLSMLVHQAAVAFELWTGRDAPVEVMARAARGGTDTPGSG